MKVFNSNKEEQMQICTNSPKTPVTPNVSRTNSIDSPKLVRMNSPNINRLNINSPKISRNAIGHISANLVKTGDVVYLDNKLCKVISKTDENIIGVEVEKYRHSNATSMMINYKIKCFDEQIRFEILDPETYNERTVRVSQ